MGIVSPELAQNPLLYQLAEKMCDEPGGFDRYNYAKCVWLGNPDRATRLTGQHPWPTRMREGKRYIYSVPVLAGFSAERQKLLYIGKDNWKPVDDPNAWLVSERGLLRGEETERRVLGVRVDGPRQLRLHIATEGYDNFPPILQEAMRRKPAYDQTAITGRLDEGYNLREAIMSEGLGNPTFSYEDIEALESMIVVIQQLRQAEEEQTLVEMEADFQRALGMRGMEMAYAA